MSASPRVLLATTLVADDRKVLASVRGLAREGAWIAVASNQLWGEAYYSRHVDQRLRYPHPSKEPDAFLETLRKHVRQHRIDVVLPMNDYTMLALSAARGLLHPWVRTALAPADSLSIARDKQQTLALAKRLGIDVPATCMPTSREHLRQQAANLRFPCVFKLNSGAGAVGMRFAADERELLAIWDQPRQQPDTVFDYERILIQEYLPGQTRDVCAVCSHGEIVAALVQRRRWMYPSKGGMGISVEISEEPALIEQAALLLRELAWHGPVIVEFRVDPDTGRTSLMEINGRMGGSSDAGIHAGINYPWLWTQLALGHNLPPSKEVRVGMRFRWPVPFALLSLRIASPSAVFREMLKPAPDTHCDLQLRDPLPHIAEALFAARRIAGRVINRG